MHAHTHTHTYTQTYTHTLLTHFNSLALAVFTFGTLCAIVCLLYFQPAADSTSLFSVHVLSANDDTPLDGRTKAAPREEGPVLRRHRSTHLNADIHFVFPSAGLAG